MHLIRILLVSVVCATIAFLVIASIAYNHL
jgi:hypothetical protein